MKEYGISATQDALYFAGYKDIKLKRKYKVLMDIFVCVRAHSFTLG
jgi:hypothetical protein